MATTYAVFNKHDNLLVGWWDTRQEAQAYLELVYADVPGVYVYQYN